MLPEPIRQQRPWYVVPALIVCLTGAPAAAQTAQDVLGNPAVVPLQNEPPAKIVVDPPLPEPLSQGRVVIRFRTENLHMLPVFGPTVLPVSPRVGHVHVTLDDNPWLWMDATEDPVILNGLPPGPHKVLIQLETANHQLLDRGSVSFTVPQVPAAASTAAPVQLPVNEPPAKIVIDAPLAEPLSRGVVYIQYRAENLRIFPVYGPAALGVDPRVGHIHVSVDGAQWHWADASGNPVIINGLAPGPHKILIQLVNANHQPIDQGTVDVTVPKPKT
jgi:hypothetical protein